jgi:hydroxylaminobenzene mutase
VGLRRERESARPRAGAARRLGRVTTPALRHPMDPEPVRSTKAAAVLALGVVAVLSGPLIGGVVPATVALTLARQARREAYASGGFLTGAVRLRRGERLAWAGLVLAIAAVVVAVVVGLLDYASTPPGRDFGPNVN